ncbi:MAG: MATE family efflux transporter [Clostridia bacterium]|nr:MATE family efflux transporter [Clostridia bacterium]
MSKNSAVDMTRGSITRQMVQFSLPLIFGNLFQLAYNMVDTAVIGRFAGSAALAAVGTCDSVMTLLILGVSGVCIGASVLMGNFYGAGDTEKLKQELGTTIVIGMVFAAAVMAVGLPLTEPVLQLLRVQPEAMADGALYLRIIFLGMPFTCLYNIYAGAMRAVGDSKTPVRYLALASVINMALDVLLVAVLKLGVGGAGAATVAAEAVSAVLCIRHVNRHMPVLQLKGRAKADRALLGQTLSLGSLTALQQCSQPIGNLFIQGVINSAGMTAAAAFSAVRKIEDIGLIPGRSVANGITAFMAQNEGAGDTKRSERGFKVGLMLEVAAAAIICAVILLLRHPLMMLFTADETIRETGAGYFSLSAFFYWMPGFCNAHQGYFRGIKKMQLVLMGSITQIAVRAVMTAVLVPKMGLPGAALACMIGWGAMLAWEAPCRLLHTIRRMKTQKSA